MYGQQNIKKCRGIL